MVRFFIAKKDIYMKIVSEKATFFGEFLPSVCPVLCLLSKFVYETDILTKIVPT